MANSRCPPKVSADVYVSRVFRCTLLGFLTTCPLLLTPSKAVAETLCTTFTGPTTDSDKFIAYNAQSAYQTGMTKIRILVPEPMSAETKYPVVYVLPVEPGMRTEYGDGLLEVKNRNLHNLHKAIFVQPSFSNVPWYADAISDPRVRQESYFVNAVVPFIDRIMPVESTHRFLLGFSKSGCGAFSLLLRHPHLFRRAAAWDAPLAMRQMGRYESSSVFENQSNFEKYRITDLITARAGLLREDEIRLILSGYNEFGSHMRQVDRQLTSLDIPHVFSDVSKSMHSWSSGWLPDAVQTLLNPPSPSGTPSAP